MNTANTPATSLAERLVAFAERGPGDAYYRLSRVVARVLVSRRLRQRKKWCDLARQLAQNPGVEDRLVMQAMRWLGQEATHRATMNWTPPPPRWDTLAGKVLDSFFAAVHQAMPDYDQPLTIFGSAPIQLCLDEDFASADVDIMVLEGGEMLRRIAAEAGLGRAGTVRAAFGVQICPPLLFNPTPHYLQRAHTEVRHGLTIIVPHLRDILIAKLHRSRVEGQEALIPKDRRAFQRVRELSGGHPTLPEFLQDLVNCESSFRPAHDGGLNSFRFNAENALHEIYGHHLDLKRDILDPAAIATQPPGQPPPGFIAERLKGLEK